MASDTTSGRRPRFVENLGKVYLLYTLGFLAFFALMAILEVLGASAQVIGIGFLLFTIAIYAIIGWLSRTAEVDAYYVAGREVPALYNGMATAADWMSGASFVALAGGVYFGGYPYLGYIVGWTGGYVLVNSLMAPYLRKFGCYTVPDFVGTRYGGNTARTWGCVRSPTSTRLRSPCSAPPERPAQLTATDPSWIISGACALSNWSPAPLRSDWMGREPGFSRSASPS